MFNPAVVRDIRLLTGGFGARYGDRLSAVLDVEMRPGTPERRFAGSLNASLANGNLVLEGGAPMDGSWLVTARRTYYDLLLGLVARHLDVVEDGTSFPSFADLQGKLLLRPAPGHHVRLGAIASRDALKIDLNGTTDPGDFGSDLDRLDAGDRTRNDLAYAAWHWAPAPRLLSKLTLSWYRNGGTFGSDGRLVPRDAFAGGRFIASQDTANVFEFAYDQRFRFRKWSLAQQTTWQRGRHLLEGGAGIDLLHTTLRFDLALNDVARAYFESLQHENPFGPGAFPASFDQGKRYYRAHAYVQDRIGLFGERLFVQPGLRLDAYRILGRAYLSPRLGLSYRIGGSATSPTTLRLAWGRYRQSPGFEKLLDEGRVFDLSDGAALDALDAEQATHLIAGLDRWLGGGVQLRLEGYLKDFDGLIVQRRDTLTRTVARYVRGARTSPRAYVLVQEHQLGLTPQPENAAEGLAYGVEVVLEKRALALPDRRRAVRLWGWASYAWARASRSRPAPDHPGARRPTPFDYDRRHVGTLTLNARLGAAWEGGATFRYGTGFPYTPAAGFRPIVVTRVDPLDPSRQTPEILTNSVTGQVRFEIDYGGEANVNAARLPAYHRLDLRLARRIHPFGFDGQVYLDVINLYNRQNVLAYRYVITISDHPAIPPQIRRERIGMLPILPTLGLSLTW